MSKNDAPRKIVVTVAPVCHPGKPVPIGSKNPLSPEDIANDVANCSKAGASMVHLHVRDNKGEQTFDVSVFRKTLDLITQKTDIIIQGSTGGIADLTLEERCVCLDEPRVEVASLNMGSVNFGETVYINTLPDIRFWAKKMREKKVLPEMELFDLSMNVNCTKLADEGILDRPMHYNYCLGSGLASAVPATPQNLLNIKSLMEPGAHWGLNHDSMPDFSMLACALAMGASVVRVGFEDSFYYAPGRVAPTNALLVEKLAELIHSMGMELATPKEARKILGLDKLRN
jgi:3-keto-5-aminohexanoate cleavage enzyme